MDTRNLFAIPVLLILSSLCACSPLADVRALASQTALALNGDFVKVRQANDTMVAEINAINARAGQLDLDPGYLEQDEGGAFRFFGDRQFYFKSKQEGSCYYYCPGGKIPGTDVLAELRLMGYTEAAQAKAWQAAPDILTVVFYGLDDPADIAVMYPWFDVVSMLPPGIQLKMFEWYRRGIKSTGPSVWSAEPFLDLTTGWVMDVAGHIKRDGNRVGATVMSVGIGKLEQKHLAGSNANLVLLSHAGVVMGASPKAAALLGIGGLTAEVLQKAHENLFATADYLLGAPGQTPSAQALAAALARGQEEFSFEADGKTRWAVTVPVPESGCRLVGFTD